MHGLLYALIQKAHALMPLMPTSPKCVRLRPAYLTLSSLGKGHRP